MGSAAARPRRWSRHTRRAAGTDLVDTHARRSHAVAAYRQRGVGGTGPDCAWHGGPWPPAAGVRRRAWIDRSLLAQQVGPLLVLLAELEPNLETETVVAAVHEVAALPPGPRVSRAAA